MTCTALCVGRATKGERVQPSGPLPGPCNESTPAVGCPGAPGWTSRPRHHRAGQCPGGGPRVRGPRACGERSPSGPGGPSEPEVLWPSPSGLLQGTEIIFKAVVLGCGEDT